MGVLEKKIVIIIDSELHKGVTSNRAAVLMSGLAAKFPEVLGNDHFTLDGKKLNGFTQLPVSILTMPKEKKHHNLLQSAEKLDCDTFVFLARAQGVSSYKEYSESIAKDQFEELDIDAMLVYGERKSVNKLTGKFSSMR